MTDATKRAVARRRMSTDVPGRILPLSAEAVAQIHSSKHITSLDGVVFALLENSLDAGATHVDISVDWRRGGATVNDNGLGIPHVEFGEGGSLGKLYCTSKRSVEGGQPNETHGTSGTFLAELAAMSLLTITSNYAQDQCAAATLTLHHGKIISRRLQDPVTNSMTPSQGGGTDVVVRDLFGNMPVRVKQRASTGDSSYEDERSWQELKRGVVALLLAWPKPCSVKIRGANTGSKTVTISGQHTGAPNALTMKSLDQLAGRQSKSDLRDALPILFQSGFALPDSRRKWISLSASTSAISLQGLICLDPAPTKLCQFIAIGINPCNATAGHNELYDVVAKVFTNSNFGTVEEPVGAGSIKTGREMGANAHAAKQMQARKGVDRFPMYYIQLKFKYRSHHSLPDLDRLSDSSLKAVVDILEAALITWLESNHFQPRKKRRRRNEEQESPPKPFPSFPVVKAPCPDTTKSIQQDNRGGVTDVTAWSDHGRRIITLPDRPLSRDLDSKYNAIVDAEDMSALSRMRFGKTRDISQSALHRSSTHEGHADVRRPKSAIPAAAQHAAPTMTVKKRRMLPTPSIDAGELGGTAKIFTAEAHPAESPKDERKFEAARLNAQIAMRDQVVFSSEDFGSIDDDRMLEAEQCDRQRLYEQNHGGAEESDDNTTWTDPLSKQVFRVDSRTGIVLPLSDERHLNGSIPARQRAAVDSTLSSRNKPLTLARRSAIAMKDSVERPFTADNAEWLPGFLKQWDNPVFERQKEGPIPVASFKGPGPLRIEGDGHCCSHQKFGSCLNDDSAGTKLNKSALRAAEVIAQVDTKFILCKLPASSSELRVKTTLILIDQHAASERIVLENLLTELCAPCDGGATSIQTTCLRSGTARAHALVVEISAKEFGLFARHRAHFARWGVLYDLVSPETPVSVQGRKETREPRIRVTHLPTPVAERCASFPSLAIEMLRTEVWALEDGSRKVADDVQVPAEGEENDEQPLWLSLLSAIPPNLLALLHSRSCRSAIMFNDVLSQEQCVELVEQLGKCIFPFVCAHGRISMVPLGDMDVANADSGGEHQRFDGQAMGAWLSSTREMKVKDHEPVQNA